MLSSHVADVGTPCAVQKRRGGHAQVGSFRTLSCVLCMSGAGCDVWWDPMQLLRYNWGLERNDRALLDHLFLSSQQPPWLCAMDLPGGSIYEVLDEPPAADRRHAPRGTLCTEASPCSPHACLPALSSAADQWAFLPACHAELPEAYDHGLCRPRRSGWRASSNNSLPATCRTGSCWTAESWLGETG